MTCWAPETPSLDATGWGASEGEQSADWCVEVPGPAIVCETLVCGAVASRDDSIWSAADDAAHACVEES
jgi:hypothetical protein